MRYFAIMICAVLLLLGMSVVAQENSPPPSDTQQDKAADQARAAEESSSKDTRVDLSPPKDDVKNHPTSSIPSTDDDDAASDVQEMHPWDPHKAAKDVEVGDFYFKQKNYKAAIARYKDALIYKSNDAIAEYRLAESLDKSGSGQEAVTHYQAYLKILPHGPDAENAQKALARLNGDEGKSKSAAK